MRVSSLVVAETFYSIQGEGPTMGHPAVFLRLAGCNLLCEGKGWRCDTIEVWQKGVSTPFDEVLSDVFISHLQRGAHLVITGGEPLLQRGLLVNYLKWFVKEKGFNPYVEIETNGTIDPGGLLFDLIDQFNVSPKLPNSGESYDRRVKEWAILSLKRNSRNVCFKFVVTGHHDVIDIGDEYGMINPQTIWLMPAGDTRAKLNKIRDEIIEVCKVMHYRYSERLHIVAWNKKTGV